MYLYLKAFHIIAVIAWMAGMLYLPRLFVYHADAVAGSAQSETFKLMERRLLKFIMLPAMIASWLLGLALLWVTGDFAAGWLHAKFVAVVAMTIMHALFSRWANEFSHDRNRHTAKFYRIVNEIPTVLMIVIVAVAVLKPF